MKKDCGGGGGGENVSIKSPVSNPNNPTLPGPTNRELQGIRKEGGGVEGLRVAAGIHTIAKF